MGIFKMTNTTTKPVNLANLTEQEISLAEAYAESAGQDKLIADEFDSALGDGLINENMSVKPIFTDTRSS